jgi:hypothetical protein
MIFQIPKTPFPRSKRRTSSLNETMAKEKVDNQPAQSVGAASRAESSEMNFRINPLVDARLDKFIADNPDVAEHYTRLVKEHPDRAVRMLALRTMFKHEDIALKNALRMPGVKEWVSQYPGLEERIEAKIQTKNPIMRAAAFIREAVGLKRSVERAGVGVGMST